MIYVEPHSNRVAGDEIVLLNVVTLKWCSVVKQVLGINGGLKWSLKACIGEVWPTRTLVSRSSKCCREDLLVRNVSVLVLSISVSTSGWEGLQGSFCWITSI